MKTLNIKGKEYVTVNERLKAFRNNFKDYSLTTEIIELGADFCTMKATITDDKGVIRATGFAREVVAKSPINKFAFVENCETSAIGRCLGNFGIGIDNAICTADELLMKLSQETETPALKPQTLDDRVAAFKAFMQKATLEQMNSDNYKQKFNALCKELSGDKAHELTMLHNNRMIDLAEREAIKTEGANA